MSGTAAGNGPAYVCGHGPRELARLAVQDVVYGDLTALALARAGIAPGMRVVDVGAGAGDVSLRVAALVGATGEVMGVDRSADAARTATSRAQAAGLTQVRPVVAHLDAWAPDAPVDAVVGRFVLMHQADPVHLLRRLRGWLRPGGIVAFVESDLAALVAGVHSRPHSAVYARIVELWLTTIGAAGARLDMGATLGDAFVAAGLPRPSTTRWQHEAGEPTSPLFPFATESLRSMLPLARAAGLPTPTDAEMDGLETALRDEVVGQHGVIAAPPAVAAWGRLTASR